MAKNDIESVKAAYEKGLEQELCEIISELSHNPKSIIIKRYSFLILCGIRRHLGQNDTISKELKVIVYEQLNREIHDCILEIYMHCRSYEDVKRIVSQAREEEQPTIQEFLDNIQREVAVKRLNAVLRLINANQYVGQLNKYSLEELCELERHLTDCEMIELEDKALIELALQRAIEHTLATYPSIYENENRMNELLEGANPLNREGMIKHIERYKERQIAIH